MSQTVLKDKGKGSLQVPTLSLGFLTHAIERGGQPRTSLSCPDHNLLRAAPMSHYQQGGDAWEGTAWEFHPRPKAVTGTNGPKTHRSSLYAYLGEEPQWHGQP